MKSIINRAKDGKAVGDDAIPVEALCYVTVVKFLLHKMFNEYFDLTLASQQKMCLTKSVLYSTDVVHFLSMLGLGKRPEFLCHKHLCNVYSSK